MKLFILILIAYLFFNCQIVVAVVNKPLSSNETSVAISILKSLYNIDTTTFEEVCDYRGCFECSQIGPNNYVVVSIKMLNSTNPVIITENLGVFKNLLELIVGENVQLSTSFFNESLPLLKKLTELDIAYQGQPFPDNFTVPDNIANVKFSSISVPLSSNWFEYNVNSILILNTLPGFQYPNLTNQNSNIRGLVLALNHIDSNVPLMNLFPNLIVIVYKIYNDMSVQGYNNFSIDSINQEYIRVNSLEFDFINSGNQSSIQKFILEQSLISRFKVQLLEFVGIGFTLDPTVGFLNFSMMSDNGLKLNINGTCDLVNECKVENCIVLPNVVPPKTSFNQININGCITPSLTPTPTPSLSTTTTSTQTPSSSSTSTTASSNPTKPPPDEEKASRASSLSFSYYLFYIMILCLFAI
ncbi:hypothetical protein ACTA71_012423 [Dictyostelium dimigraforme]